MAYDYKTLKALMQGKEFTYQGCKATIRYIEKVNCKKGYCNVMLNVPMVLGTFKGFTISVEQLSKIYYGGLTFDEINDKRLWKRH